MTQTYLLAPRQVCLWALTPQWHLRGPIGSGHNLTWVLIRLTFKSTSRFVVMRPSVLKRTQCLLSSQRENRWGSYQVSNISSTTTIQMSAQYSRTNWWTRPIWVSIKDSLFSWIQIDMNWYITHPKQKISRVKKLLSYSFKQKPQVSFMADGSSP